MWRGPSTDSLLPSSLFSFCQTPTSVRSCLFESLGLPPILFDSSQTGLTSRSLNNKGMGLFLTGQSFVPWLIARGDGVMAAVKGQKGGPNMGSIYTIVECMNFGRRPVSLVSPARSLLHRSVCFSCSLVHATVSNII